MHIYINARMAGIWVDKRCNLELLLKYSFCLLEALAIGFLELLSSSDIIYKNK